MTFYRGPDFSRPDPALLQRFARVEVATFGHTTDFGFPRGLRPLLPDTRFVGPALTVRIPHLDSTAVHYVIDLIQPGDVIVIDQSGDDDRSSFGGGLAKVAQLKGAVGTVSNGSTNDLDELRDLGYPVISRGVTPHTTRVLGIEGAINVPVSVGGVAICPGDIVIADGDGLAVVDPARAEAILTDLEHREERLRQRNTAAVIAAGGSFAQLTGAKQKFESGLPEAS